ncbi:hypothetical protein Hanom_Chr11g01010901 [Helianthus anomalus]
MAPMAKYEFDGDKRRGSALTVTGMRPDSDSGVFFGVFRSFVVVGWRSFVVVVGGLGFHTNVLYFESLCW